MVCVRMKKILCMILLSVNIIAMFANEFSFLSGNDVVMINLLDEKDELEIIPLKEGYPTFFYKKFMDSENIFIADQSLDDYSTSFFTYNITNNIKNSLFTLQASASEPRVHSIYYHENSIYTIQYQREKDVYVLTKRDFNSGEPIFSKSLTIFEKYSRLRKPKFEVSEDEKFLILDLHYAPGTYDEKYYTAIISLDDGREVFYDEARYLSFSHKTNEAFVSKNRFLFSIAIDSDFTPKQINEFNNFNADNKDILYFKQQDNYYIVGVEKKRISYIAKFFFDYGYYRVFEYYLYSKNNGVFTKETKLYESEINGKYFTDSFIHE